MGERPEYALVVGSVQLKTRAGRKFRLLLAHATWDAHREVESEGSWRQIAGQRQFFEAGRYSEKNNN